MIADALERELYEQPRPTANLVWDEGDPLPRHAQRGPAEPRHAPGEAYWLFRNTFGRDSYDGAGATMQTVNNDPTHRLPERQLERRHHQLLQRRHLGRRGRPRVGPRLHRVHPGLIYQYQSGALNESYSDIWGETVDLINGRQDEGEGDITAKRPDGHCSTHTGAPALVTINSPAGDRRPCDRPPAPVRPGVRRRPASPPTSSWHWTPPTPPGPRRPTAARRSPTPRRSPARSRSSTAAPAPSRSRSRTPRPPAPPASSSATTSEARPPRMAGADPTITDPVGQIRPSDRDRIVGTLATGVNVTMQDDTGDRDGLLPLADRREVHGLRRRDPRHVEPDLLRRPGQGLGRRVLLRHRRRRRRAQQLRCAEPRATPCWSTVARTTASPSPASVSTRPPTSAGGHDGRT